MITAHDTTDGTFRAKIVEALQRVVDPCSIATGAPINLIDMGLIESIETADGKVSIEIWPTSAFCFQMPIIRDQVVSRVSDVDGVTSVECFVSERSDWMPSRMASGVRTSLRLLRPMGSASGALPTPPA